LSIGSRSERFARSPLVSGFLINQAAELDVELLVLIPQHPAGPALLAEPVSDLSSPPSSWSAGPIADAFATKQRSPLSPASPHSKPAAANAPGTGSAEWATETSTAPCTPLRSPGSAAMKIPATKKQDAAPKARPTATFAGA
jgi:hypothetical protein